MADIMLEVAVGVTQMDGWILSASFTGSRVLCYLLSKKHLVLLMLGLKKSEDSGGDSYQKVGGCNNL